MKIENSGMAIGKPGYCLLKKHPKTQHILDLDCWQELRRFVHDNACDYETYVQKCKNK